MDHTTLRGRIVSWYEERKGDRNRSREDFTITKHADGLRVLRSFCQLYDNGIIRDVVLAMDKDYSPRDASIRVMVDDNTQGTAWYSFTDDSIECEALTDAGRISQRASRDDTSATLGTHALQSDAWLLAKLDYTQPGRQSMDNIPFCSSHHIGATGPHLEFVGASVEYLGDEEITVGSGTFPCHHVRFVETSNDHPPYDVWVSADGDYLFLKGFVGGDWKVHYELVWLEEE